MRRDSPLPRRSSRLLASATGLSLTILSIAYGALADIMPVVYHSPLDDGARPISTPIIPGGSAEFMLHLYMDEEDGSATASISTPCEAGDGWERCGWDLEIEAVSGPEIDDFIPDGDVVAGISFDGVSRLRFNGGEVEMGELGPVKLGDLRLKVTSSTGQVDLVGGTVVDTGLQKVGLPGATLAIVPEPDRASLFFMGALCLAWLSRKRCRRMPDRRPCHVAARRARSVAIMAAVVPVLLTVTPLPTQAQSLCDPGDLNADGSVDIADSTVLRRDLAGLGPGIDPSCVPPDADPYGRCRTGRTVSAASLGNTCGFGGAPGAPALPEIALTEKNYSELFSGTGYAPPFGAASAARGCGACLEVFGPNGSAVGLVVSVADVASVGEMGKPNTPHLSPGLMTAIGRPAGLQGEFTFRVVPCPLAGNIQIRRYSFSSTALLGFSFYNHLDAIELVEFREDEPGQPWATMSQTWTNRWEYSNASSTYGFKLQSTHVKFRITSLLGDVVETGAVPLPSFTMTSEAYFDAAVQLPTRPAPGGVCTYTPTCGDGYVDLAAQEECEPLLAPATCGDLGLGGAADVACDPQTCRHLPWECTP